MNKKETALSYLVLQSHTSQWLLSEIGNYHGQWAHQLNLDLPQCLWALNWTIIAGSRFSSGTLESPEENIPHFKKFGSLSLSLSFSLPASFPPTCLHMASHLSSQQPCQIGKVESVWSTVTLLTSRLSVDLNVDLPGSSPKLEPLYFPWTLFCHTFVTCNSHTYLLCPVLCNHLVQYREWDNLHSQIQYRK